ncbi:MFS transporter [Leucobacter sp. UCMA 4100]|uniref:MFS transporter n=1 Tax=Leucobacter sp. UCMA 4100 TaxID=2810534 RepID=UPI0022EA9DFF|nr:MFS transporter [Leucobacter sp. UCMA 4100]MDA3147411.1 MFS transporter [Leucobacter sp. UCMA 4100]
MNANNTTPQQGAAVKVGAVVGFLIFVELTSGFIQGYYLPLFGSIAQHLGVSDADITWFNTIQTLAAAVCVPILAKLGDMFGHRRMLRIGIISVFIGVLITAFVPSYPAVLAGRLLVGPLAVWLPLEIAIIHSRIQGETGRKAIGFLVSALTGGAVLGSIVGGLFGSRLPIVIALAVPAIIVLLCVIVVFTVVPDSFERNPVRIDWLGFILLAVSMLALLFGMRLAQAEGFASLTPWACLIVGFVAVAVFVWWELRIPNPAINIRVVTSRALWPAYATSFLFGMALFGTQTITTTFLAAPGAEVGYGFGFKTSVIGLFTAGSALCAVIGAAVFANLARVITIRGVLLLAVSVAAVGNIMLAVGHTSLTVVIVSIVASGLAGGLLLGALPALVAERSPRSETGIATGLYNTLKTLGGALAGAVFAVVLSAFTAPGAAYTSAGGYVSVWIICAAGFALAALILLLVRVQGTQTMALTVQDAETEINTEGVTE